MFDNYKSTNSIKHEYASPESLPYSPPSLSPAQLGQQATLFQSSASITASPQPEPKSLPTSTPLDFMNWNANNTSNTMNINNNNNPMNSTGASLDSQGKKKRTLK